MRTASWNSETTNTLRRYIHLAKTADRRIPLMLRAIYQSGGLIDEDNVVAIQPRAVLQDGSESAF